MTNTQDRQEAASQQRSPLPYSDRQMLPPFSSFAAAKDAAQRLSPQPNTRGLHRGPSGSEDSTRIQRPLSASSQRVDGQLSNPRDYPTAHSRPTHLGASDRQQLSPSMDAPRKTSPSGLDRIMHDAPARYPDGAYTDRAYDPSATRREEQHPPLYHRHSESGPSNSYRDDWTPAQDRAAMQNDAYARRMEEARWLEERSRRAEQGPYSQSGYMPQGRSFDDMDEDMRHLKRRGTFSTFAEVPSHRHGMHIPSHPSAGPRSYSPPNGFVHNGAPRSGAMTPMEAPRPASAVGVMAVPGGAPTASPSTASSGTSTVNANRRVAHLLSEQKRRESINTGFEDLRQAIPTCRDGQDSKATILRRALEYIRELESIVDHSHRVKSEGHSMGGFDTRSPPDDQDGLRRLGRPGDDARRDPRMSRRGPNGGNDPASGPHIGGMPGNSYALHQPGIYAPRSLPIPRYAQAESRLVQATTQGLATHVKEEPAKAAGLKRPIEQEARSGSRDSSRRRVSDDDQVDSTNSPDSSHSSSSAARYVVAHPNDGETVPASFAMRALHPSPSIARSDAEKPRQAARLIHC